MDTYKRFTHSSVGVTIWHFTQIQQISPLSDNIVHIAKALKATKASETTTCGMKCGIWDDSCTNCSEDGGVKISGRGKKKALVHSINQIGTYDLTPPFGEE